MNANNHKTVFSERLGTLVAVGENARSQGKANGAGLSQGIGAVGGFVGALAVGFALVGLAWAGPVVTALPTGGQVAQGTASISQSGAVMSITQSTAKAVVNWSSFDIGSQAKVNITQPGADAVMLNRVTGANPSQIFGQFNANGQVVLVNPNGVLFGKDGSVNAISFTASTLGITDANFMAGNLQYERNGATAAVINQGSIKTTGGYVALLGASVSNEGSIQTQGGTAYLAAAEAIKVPISGSGRIKLELSPSSINAAVSNAKGAAIVTNGGQVYMQAAALNNAVANIIQSGSIDSTGEQGGAVHLLADSGQIKVDGSITANSTTASNKGGDIVIGRDEETGALAKATDVSSAKLESSQGFVETSGQDLKFEGVSVVAKQWLLDPVDVNIDATNAATIGTNLGTTDVTIQTTGTTLGVTSAGTGNITISNAITKAAAAGANTTLTLLADNGITVNAAIGAAAGAGKLNVVMTANGQTDGVAAASMTATQRALSRGILVNNTSINANGGDITLVGTSYADRTIANNANASATNAIGKGVQVHNGTNLTGNNIVITGVSEVLAGATGTGVLVQRYPTAAILSATGHISITGTVQGAGNGYGLNFATSDWGGQAPSLTASGSITLRGNNRASTSNTNEAISITSGVQAIAGGSIVLQGETNNAAANAINVASNYASTWGVGGALQGNMTLQATGATIATGYVLIQANQGSIVLNNQLPNNLSSGSLTTENKVTGFNIIIDNTGAGMTTGASNTVGTGSIDTTTNTGVIVKGAGKSTSSNSGIKIADGRMFTARNNIHIFGVGTSGSGLEISGAAALTANTVGNVGNINLSGENTTSAGAAINISNASSTITALNVVALNANASNGGTSLLESGSITTSGELQVSIPTTGTISGAISGAGLLRKVGTNGAGTLMLTGANTYTGGTTANGGILQVGNGGTVGSLGMGAISVAAVLAVKRSDNYLIADNIAGTGQLWQTGSGTTILTGTNSYVGATTISAGALQIGNGGSMGTLGSGAVSVATGSSLTFNRSDTWAVSNAISGAGTVTQFGSGTVILTGANSYSGTTTISAGALQVGNGGTTGTLGTGGVIDNAALVFNRSDSQTVAGAISGTGTLTQSGSGTTILTGANSYAGMTTIAAGTLQVGNGGSTGTLGSGAVVDNANLSYARSAATTIANDITGTGNVSAIITGASSHLTVDHTINLTGGTVNLATDGNVLLSKAIATTNTTSAAIFIESGKATAAGTSTGGDVQISGTGALTVGAGGRATVMTGSVAGSTGLTTVVGLGSGHFRYNSDESASNYTTTLGTGLYAIYRESPTLTGAVNNEIKTYNGLNYAGTNGSITSLGGFVNGDTNAQLGTVTYSAANSQNAGTYSITGGVSSPLGYSVSLTSGILTVNKADLTLSGSRTYDRGTTFSGQYLTATGVNGETFTVTGSGDASNLSNKNVQTNQALASVTSLALGTSSNGGLSSNYNGLSVTGSSVSVTAKAATVNGTTTSVTYNGSTQNQAAATTSGILSGDAITISGAASGRNAGTYASTLNASGTDAGNYSFTYNNANLVIGQADLVLSGTRVYNGEKTFAGTYLTAMGVHGETFGITGAGDISNLTSKNVQANQSLNSVTGLSLGSSSNGGLSINYKTLSASGSNVSVTTKAAAVTGTATSMTYNGLTQNQMAATTSGIAAGDEITISGEASGKSAGTYASHLYASGADVGNYNFSVTNANLIIAQAPLTVTSSSVTKTYDAGLGASGVGIVGVLAGAAAGDVVNSAGSQAFLNKDAGTGKTVRASGVSIKDAVGRDVTSNYAITYIDDTASAINPARLTITANGDARFVTQSDVANFNGVSYAGLVAGETAGVLAGNLAINRTNAVSDVAAKTYTGVLMPSGLTSNNYSISFVGGNYTIVPANQLLIKTNNVAVTYGTAPTYITTAQYLGGNNVIYTLTQSGNTFSDNAGGSVTVALKPYTGRNLAGASGSGNTVVGNYDIKDAAPVVVGSNFVGSPVFTGSLSVTTKAVTPSASGVSKSYDATTSMNNVVVGFSGALTGDRLSISGTGTFSQKNVGTNLDYTISGLTLSGNDAANYYLSGGSTSFTGHDGVITPAPLALSTLDVVKTYDRSTNAAGAAVAVQSTRLFDGDTLSGGIYTFNNANAGTGNKTVIVSDVTVNDGNGGANYSVSYVNNTSSTINKAALTVMATAVSKTYDGTLSASGTTGAVGALVTGDVVNSAGTQAYLDANAGVGKTVRASGVTIKDGANADMTGNYQITYQDVNTGVINKALLTATLVGSVSKEYDSTTAASNLTMANYSVTGWANVGEGVTVRQTAATYASATVANNAGTGSVSASLQASDFAVVGGTNLGNYVLPTSASGLVGTITRAPLTVKVNDTSMFVTQSLNTAVDNGFAYTGLKNGETATTVLGALSRRYTGAANPATGSYGGVFDLSTTPTAANYTVTVQKGSLTVVPADKLLIHVGSNNVGYGTLTAANAGTAAASVTAQYCLDANNCNGANIANLMMSQQGTRWTATDASNSTISFNTVVDTTGKLSSGGFVNVGNYIFATDSLSTTGTVNFNGTALNAGVLTVDPKMLTLSAGSVTKVYDGSTALAGRALMPNGGMSEDHIQVTSTGGNFSDKNVGRQSFTLTGLQLLGLDRANYAFAANDMTGTGTITPKALTVTATVQDKVYDGNTSAKVTMGTLTGLVGSEQLWVTATGSFQNATTGIDKPVDVRYSLEDGAFDGKASNYSAPAQMLKASILALGTHNPVQPVVVPARSLISESTVVIAKAQAAVGLSDTEGRNESREACSDIHPDQCECQDTAVPGVQMCVVSVPSGD